jgi:hypothetical protein
VGGDLANTSIHACLEKELLGKLVEQYRPKLKRKKEGEKRSCGGANVVKAVAVKQPCQAP